MLPTEMMGFAGPSLGARSRGPLSQPILQFCTQFCSNRSLFHHAVSYSRPRPGSKWKHTATREPSCSRSFGDLIKHHRNPRPLPGTFESCDIAFAVANDAPGECHVRYVPSAVSRME